jgi:hypothetical protein
LISLTKKGIRARLSEIWGGNFNLDWIFNVCGDEKKMDFSNTQSKGQGGNVEYNRLGLEDGVLRRKLNWNVWLLSY